MTQVTDKQKPILMTPTRTQMNWLPYPGSVARHLLHLPVWLYRLGLGQVLAPMRLMVLTTWGRKTGLPRHTAIEYRAHGSKLYVVSGWGQRPNWYRNLVAQPVARIRRGQHLLNARATVVTDPGESLRVLYLFRKRAPFIYDPLLARLSNRQSVNPRTLAEISDQFTIVRLEPADDVVGPPAVEADLKWLGVIIGIVMTVLAANLMRRGRAS